MKFPPIYHYIGPEEERGAWIKESQKVIRIADSPLYNENVKRKRYIKNYADGSFINIVKIGNQYMLNIVAQPTIPIIGRDEFMDEIEEYGIVFPVGSDTTDNWGDGVLDTYSRLNILGAMVLTTDYNRELQWILKGENYIPPVYGSEWWGIFADFVKEETEDIKPLALYGFSGVIPVEDGEVPTAAGWLPNGDSSSFVATAKSLGLPPLYLGESNVAWYSVAIWEIEGIPKIITYILYIDHDYSIYDTTFQYGFIYKDRNIHSLTNPNQFFDYEIAGSQFSLMHPFVPAVKHGGHGTGVVPQVVKLRTKNIKTEI